MLGCPKCGKTYVSEGLREDGAGLGLFLLLFLVPALRCMSFLELTFKTPRLIQQKCISSLFWRPEVQGQGIEGLLSSKASLRDLEMAAFPCVLTRVFLWVSVSPSPLLIRTAVILDEGPP